MQAHEAPRRRADLSLSAVQEAEGAVTVVHHPQTGKYFRLREIEGSILSQLDGRRNLEAVHAAVLREFPGARLSLATVVSFAERLEKLGWLEGRAGERPRRLPLHRRLLFFKIPLLRPERLFTALQPLVRLAYTRTGLLLALAIVLISGSFALLSLPELVATRPIIADWRSFVLIWVGFTLISIPHELGHGLTCRYFGAKAHSLGFLFLYGVPAFYCDVSGAWTLSSRRQRLLIGWAGLAWQFVAAAVVFWVWRVLEPWTLAARIASVMLGACGFTALLNLNPLIRLDGYYLLSDWLGIPNLRRNALAFWGQRLRHWFLGAPAPAPGRREGRVYAWFGALSFLYSAALFSAIGYWLYATLTRYWAGFGAAVFAGLLVLLAGSWWRSRRPRASSGSAPPQDSEAAPPPRKRTLTMRIPWRLLATTATLGVLGWAFWQATWDFTVASPCALEATQRVAVRPRVAGVLSSLRYREGDRVAAGAVIGRLDTYDLERRRDALALRIRTAEIERQAIESAVPLVVAQNEVEVADKQEEVQAAQETEDDRAEVYPERRAAAERRVQEARAALDAAEHIADRLRADEREVAAGRLTPSLQALDEQIAEVRAQMGLADKKVARAQYLVSEGAIAQQRLDIEQTKRATLARREASLRSQQRALEKTLREDREDAEGRVRHLRAAYAAALQDQRQVERETRPLKIQAAKRMVTARQQALESTRALRQAAQIKRTEALAKSLDTRALRSELSRLERRIAEATVLAPAAGIISTPRLEERLGKRLEEGETLCWLDQTGALRADIRVSEKEIGAVRTGQRVELRLGTFPNRTFEASVQEISRRTELRDNQPSYEVRLRIPNGDGSLRPGMQGFAKVFCGRRPLRTVLFHRLNRYLRTEVWTWF